MDTKIEDIVKDAIINYLEDDFAENMVGDYEDTIMDHYREIVEKELNGLDIEIIEMVLTAIDNINRDQKCTFIHEMIETPLGIAIERIKRTLS